MVAGSGARISLFLLHRVSGFDCKQDKQEKDNKTNGVVLREAPAGGAGRGGYVGPPTWRFCGTSNSLKTCVCLRGLIVCLFGVLQVLG